MIDARTLLGGDPTLPVPQPSKPEGPTDQERKLAAMNPEGGRWFIRHDPQGRPVAIVRDGVEVLYLDRLAARNAATLEEIIWSLNQYSDLVRGKELKRECPVCKKQFTGANETCSKKCQSVLFQQEINK